MEITKQQEGEVTVLSLEGRLDHAGATIFQERALAEIHAGVRRMVVNFGGTSFVASMGIRSIIVPAQELAKNDGKLALTGLSPELNRLFQISGLLSVFSVFETCEAAVASLTAN